VKLWLSQPALDRAAHRRADPQWLAEAWSRSRVLVVDPASGHVNTTGEPPQLEFIKPEAAPDGDRLYLGGEDEPYFAVAAAVSDGAGLRELGPQLPDFDAGVLTEALALVHWHTEHRFHSASGNLTEVHQGGWERRDGDVVTWPRTDPAIMVLITDGGDRCLLANGVGWPDNRYSCIAGFVEPGESLEAAARREVREEVGVDLTDLSYVGSQPWPFPRSLMIAFEGVADPAQPLVLQEDEIAAARWFDREDILAGLAGRPGPLHMPPSISIARYLMERWVS
jgi:NAD+ diphosphatase